MVDPREVLNDEELGILIEALQAWERKDDASNMMVDLLEGIAGRHAPASERQQIAEAVSMQKREHKSAAHMRHESSVLLQAKLIGLRARIAVDNLTRVRDQA